MAKDKMYVHINMDVNWIKGFLEGCNGGTWSKFKTNVLRKVKEECKQVGSSCTLHFVMNTGFRDDPVRIYSVGDYGVILPPEAKTKQVVARAKSVVKLELKKLKDGWVR